MNNPYESFDEQTPRFGDQYQQVNEPAETVPVSENIQALENDIPDAAQASASAEGGQASWQPQTDYAVPVYAVPCDTAANKAVKKTRKKAKAKKTGAGPGTKLIAVALCCSLVGGLLGAGAMALFTRGGKNPAASANASKVSTLVEGNRESSIVNVAKVDTSKLMTPAEVYAVNVNSTVGITTSVTTTNFWGYQTTAAASGSGFIISDDGYILTNFHVIEGANSVTVTMYDDTTYDAELVGYDESNDIAVLKIEGENLAPVILGNSDELQVGDSVVAIGNPLGELTFSLTSGTVSALDRKVTLSNGVSMELIQTDCAINSGNSGGALLNLYGEVIGITNAKYSGSGSGAASIDNIGFAIPINTVSDIVKSIIEKGYIAKPYIGVMVDDVSEEAIAYGLPKGAAVRSVTEDGPAAKAGLQENDIITKVNGTEISGSEDLVKAVGDLEVGKEIVLTVYRQNETLELTLTVEEKIQQAKPDGEEQPEQGDAQPDGDGYAQPYEESPYGSPFGGMDPFSFFFGNGF